jgi:hypothetical protein
LFYIAPLWIHTDTTEWSIVALRRPITILHIPPRKIIDACLWWRPNWRKCDTFTPIIVPAARRRRRCRRFRYGSLCWARR